MTNTDVETIVKRIAKEWKEKSSIIDHANDPHRNSMLAYRYALEMCGLTLNEIISLGDSNDIDKSVEELFSKNQLTHK